MNENSQERQGFPVGFNWLEYLSLNPDIQHMTRVQAEKHWLEKGQFENRVYHMKNKIRVSDNSTEKHHGNLVYSAIIGDYEESKRPNIELDKDTPLLCLEIHTATPALNMIIGTNLDTLKLKGIKILFKRIQCGLTAVLF